MPDELFKILSNLHHLTAIGVVLTAALFGYAIYGTVVMTKILHDVRRMTQEVLRRLPERE